MVELQKNDTRKHMCNCKGDCNIHHSLYNWSRPKNADILNKTRNLLGMPVQCEKCNANFANSEDLKTHYLAVHTLRNIHTCTANQWGLNFLDFGQN